MKETKKGVQMNPSNSISLQPRIKSFGSRYGIPKQLKDYDFAPTHPDEKGKWFLSKESMTREQIEAADKYKTWSEIGLKKNLFYISWKTLNLLPYSVVKEILSNYDEFSIKTGKQDGASRYLITVDLDNTNGNADQYLKVFKENMKTTFIRTTPSGGYHLHYELPSGTPHSVVLKGKQRSDLRAHGLDIEILNGVLCKEIGPDRHNENENEVARYELSEFHNDLIKTIRVLKPSVQEIVKPLAPVGEFNECKNPLSMTWEEMETILNETYLPVYIKPEHDGYRDTNILFATMGVLRRYYTKEICLKVFEWINDVAEYEKIGRRPDARHYNWETVDRYGIPELDKRGFGEFIKRVVPSCDCNELINSEIIEKYPKCGVYNDPINGECGTYTEDKKGNEYFHKYVYGGIITITIIENPLINMDTLEMEMVLSDGRIMGFRGADVEHILRNNRLKIITRKSITSVTNIINNIFGEWQTVGRIIHKIDIDKTGIFYFDNEIHFSNIQIPEKVNKERLRSAMRLLENMIYKYGYNRVSDLANLYKIFIAAPFEFMAKQLRNQGLMQFKEAFWLTMVLMYGIGKDGKSFHTNNIVKMWGHHIKGEQPEWNHGDGAFDTAARIGDVLSETTFPKGLEEINSIFDEKKQYLLELLKRGRDATDVRGIVIQGNDWYSRQIQKFLSLSIPIITTNKDNIDLMKAMERRTLKIYFNDEYKKNMQHHLDEFQEKVVPHLDLLSEIGAFILKKLEDEGINLIKPHVTGFDFADCIIQDIYKYLDEPVHNLWITPINTDFNLLSVYANEAEHIIEHYRKRANIKTHPPIRVSGEIIEDEDDQKERVIRDNFSNHPKNSERVLLLKTYLKDLKNVNHELDHVQTVLTEHMKAREDPIDLKMIKYGYGYALSISITDLIKLLDYKIYVSS